jgi:cadherin-like protein/Big-like domain-containing protein
MPSINFKSALLKSGLAASVLLLASTASFGQQTVNLTAAPATATMPDGTAVPMWGYSCGTAVATNPAPAATCTALNKAVAAAALTATPLTGVWSPVVITVPSGQALTISLTNSLTFSNGNSVPTSLTIVGQLGGGLGSTATSIASPDHTNAQPLTWPIAADAPGAPVAGVGTPPTQGTRVQSFSTEVAAGATTSLTWTAPRPGTYLLESGTHPSIQGPMGLYGIVVVTTAPAGTTAGCAYPGAAGACAVLYNADIPLLLSEIDAVQNAAVSTAVNTAGFSETNVWSAQSVAPGVGSSGCGAPINADGSANPTFNTCYPPAVNYTPTYYLVNGSAFDKTNASASLFAATPTSGVTGSVLVRIVNAGLRMHVPSIVGAQTNLLTAGTTAGTTTATVVPGMELMAEDGNPPPGLPRVQSEVFMPAGKTYDVMINVPARTTALGFFDRELSLSANSIARDAGMLAYISVNGAGLPAAPSFVAAVARPDSYPSLTGVTGQTITVADPGKGVIANDTNVSGVTLLVAPANGTVTLNRDGTFTYAASGAATSDSFTYCANGTVTGATCSSGITATVSLGAAAKEAASGITVANDTYTAATGPTTTNPARLSIAPPGVLANDHDTAGFPLSVDLTTVTGTAGGASVLMQADGSFVATATAAGTYTFTYKAINSQGTQSPGSATVTLTFPAATNLAVTVKDPSGAVISDYRWIIEEDRTFYVNPNCTANPPPVGCPSAASGIVPTFGTNFHTSYMPLIATGCTGPLSCESGQTMLDPAGSGAHVNAVCDIGNGVCEPGTQMAILLPSQVVLNPTKRYYISVLPGDAANPFETGNASPGHGMGGAPIAAGCIPVAPATTCTPTAAPAVTILTQPTPFPPSKLSVFVFEDDFPLNGEQDGGGGIDVLSPNEPGLGGFNITLFDDAGGSGDATGQMTYDMFNMPLSNSLAGTIDPATGLDACPISKVARQGTGDSTQTGITGTIVTCPKFESDGTTLSPIAGQAVVANLMPGRYGVVATPAADRIARGEEWLQTNTLDGQKAHDSFLRIGEPSFFQEYGPAGYHVSIGFANPAIINARKDAVCGVAGAGTDPNITGTNCTNSVTGLVTMERMSRTPDERLYSSGDNSSFSFTQCYVSFGDADGEDFAFTKCNPDGTFTLSGLPDGQWRVTVFDQWNDMLVDGLSTPVRLSGGNTLNLGELATNQWQSNIYTTTFFDANGNGVRDGNEAGLTLVATNNRFRDGSYSNFNNTDLSGNAGFNEIFPLFSWYVIETDTTRYKNTGTHVVYDAGGPADGSSACTNGGTAPCGNSTIGSMLANTVETVSVPTNLRVPGAVYCASADCGGKSIKNGPASSDPPSACTFHTDGSTTCATILSTGRIDPPWVATEGWQGFSGQNEFIEFGKAPFASGENGGIHGEVIYASTRPFDDPQLLLHTSWTPDVPGVTINLYQVGTAADGITQTLKLIDTTKTSSWDDWAQGFYPGTNKPYMNCPGQMAAPTTTSGGDLFFFTLFNQPMYLDVYNNNGTPAHTMPNNSQFKCYDGMHNWNQVQPAPYDGMYQFPSIVNRDPTSGAPANIGTGNPAGTGVPGSMVGTNCTICTANPTDGTPMLPRGHYVVEMIVPPGYELVKEEDKNILIGDNYIAPVTQQFAPLGSIYIMPDQASVSAAYNANQPGSVSGYNANNWQNPTQSLGRMLSLSSHEGDTGSVESYWPCVGATRVVPDYISLFPQSLEVSPFAGAVRNLCDRKLVTLDDQTSALAKFWIFTSAHAAAHFTGVITDDYTSEFDPFSPQFGEKFSPANLPVAIKDWSGAEISRVYADQWGNYDGLTYSTWEVNPPNPTGYAPTMMVTCMNDPGSGAVPDPLYQPAYSDFCYEIPFMPGQTQYMDTPVVPTSAFAGAGYNNPDCDYPDATPAVSEVDVDSNVGPWATNTAASHTLHIFALGNVPVNNYGYSGPAATTAPFNQKTLTRHYGFGASQGSGSVALIGADGTRVPLTVTNWGDLTITATVPANLAAGLNCPIQQQVQYGGPATTSPGKCGQLVITAGNGRQSVDTVTVTIGGKAPTHVTANGASSNTCGGTSFGSIQRAIDCASPGDMIMLDPRTRATTTAAAVPAVHEELVLMWKPVRLQGVGAGGSVINGNTHPAGKLDPWRRQVNCLFGLAINGQPFPTASGQNNPFDSDGKGYSCPVDASTTPMTTATANFNGTNVTLRYWMGRHDSPQVDRLPLEAVVGWDASQNGNLAELLQEPSLMGALEGAGVTVLSKGLLFPTGQDPFGLGSAAAGTFPAGTLLLNNSTSATIPPGGFSTVQGCGPNTSTAHNPYPGNFYCNPSSIDGVTVTNSSQGGGGVFVHGWGHDLQIANNRVTNNAGTLGGGVNVGQGEFPGAYTQGGANADPGSCQTTAYVSVLNAQLPYCFNVSVNMHHNAITRNSSTGDELFSATPAGAGGVNICNGADYYKFNYNWLCGNLSSGDGGGMAHIGYSYNGDIEHNSILFNQSTNPTIPTNGGGLLVMGAPDVDPTCGATTDQDCLNPSPVAPGDGTGPGLTINANLIMGNGAESGSGGGIRLQGVNGTDVITFPGAPANWYQVIVTNNIITNNVAGWDGAGISLLDALKVNIVNNTIASNDTTASSGVLFNTIGAPLASSQGPCPAPRDPDGTCPAAVTTSTPQPAGVVAIQNSSNMTANLPSGVVCPTGHPNCTTVSYPLLYNNVIWQNRAFNITIAGMGTGTLNQQNVVALVPALNQTTTGQCVASTNYWDIGVRGDTGPSNHGSGVTLAPTFSVLTNTTGYDASNRSTAPGLISQYCNGARVPPENGGLGYNVPPGISDATVPNPIFNLTPAATVDEGNNWVNISWGPLSLINPSTNVALGNYGLAAGGSAVNNGTNAQQGVAAPTTDFFGNTRPAGSGYDIGAVELGATGGGGGGAATANVTGGPLNFGNVANNTTSLLPLQLTLHNTSTTTALTGIGLTFASNGTAAPRFSRATGLLAGTCTATLAANSSCTINVAFSPNAPGAFNGTLTINASSPVSGSPVLLGGTSVAVALNPVNWAPTQTGACTALNCPTQVFTLTNGTGATLTGIGHGTLGGANAGQYAIVPLASTCGPATGGQLLGQTTLTAAAPGNTCVVTVQFRPTTTGAKPATLSVTDSGGTQTSTLNGARN